LLSSHILAEVEAVCERVTIIRDGRTVESGALADLRHLSRTFLTAELDGAPPAGLDQLPGVHDLVIDGRTVQAHVEPGGLGELLRRLAQSGVRSLVSQPPTLEELFLRYYANTGERGGDASAAASEGGGAAAKTGGAGR
jgi:ABC-2 type transport system ATP-binding protein